MTSMREFSHDVINPRLVKHTPLVTRQSPSNAQTRPRLRAENTPANAADSS